MAVGIIDGIKEVPQACPCRLDAPVQDIGIAEPPPDSPFSPILDFVKEDGGASALM